MRRFITAILLAGTMVFGSINTVFAAEQTFSDVTSSTQYYDDIERLADMGILSGYDDGTFRPDNKITIAEGLTIAEKVFGDENTLPERWDDWFANQCGWHDNIHIDPYFFLGDFSREMSYETAAEIMLKINDLQPISSEMWELRSTSYNRYINTLYICGYTGVNDTVPNSIKTVMRSEFCHMVSFMLDYDKTSTIPAVIEAGINPQVYMPEMLADSTAYIRSLQSISLAVPETIREAFTRDGYEIILVPNSEWNNVFTDANDKIGFYVHTDKKIYIRLSYLDAITHEFGHYLHSTLEDQGYDISTDMEFKKLLGILNHTGDDYYLTNDAEFFSEAFKLYCSMPDKLKTEAPTVYSYIDNAVKIFERME